MGDLVPFPHGGPPVEKPATPPEPKVFDAEPVEAEFVDRDGDGFPDVYNRDGSRRDSLDAPGPTMVVDTRTSGVPAIRAVAERRDILPAWLKSRADAKSAARVVVADFWHRVRFHGIRSPHYAVKLLIRTPRGAWTLACATVAYAFGLHALPLRVQAIRDGNTDEYLKLTREHAHQLKRRLWVTIPAGVGVLVAVVLLATVAPGWVRWLVCAGVVLLLGVAGRVPDKPLVTRAVLTSGAPRLTANTVEAALGSLGIAGINQALRKGGRIEFAAPITRDGPGWRADINLPLGVTPGDILDKREALASGLRRNLGCVWPEPDPQQHAGRVVLWVGDQDMRNARQPGWPLARPGASAADVFKPIPFGTDQRGRIVTVTLMYANMLFGAMPRQGKTAALRVVLLGAALDPLAELRISELKGTGDLSPLEPVAHRYASGADDAAIEATVASLRELYKELERRAHVISDLAKRNRVLVPDNKVTPQVSAQASLGLHPVLMAIDECQELFTHEHYGAEAAKLATAVIKRGPALGLILVLATQRPDKDSLPKAISANVALRFCLKVDGQIENDMVLGTSKYQQGIRATVFTPILDAGIGYLVGATPDAKIIRTFYLDGPAAEKIVVRAHALREAAGTLSGYALGHAPQPERGPTLLADLAAVLAPGEERVWSETLVDRLAALRPEQYADLAAMEPVAKATTFASLLKPYGIDTEQVHGRLPDGKPANRRGVDAEHIRAAYQKHHGPGRLTAEGV